MSLTDYDSIATRLAQLIFEAQHMNKSRDLILAEITDFGNELLDERDAILERMEKDFHDDRLFLSSI